ncbi:tRNA 4-thiouridine(8) synthase ThiI [candidate division KSB1 bacterium]|mgnify:CR=1 FL=1|nr:MAG: tRNA 4-thiouridine(8) synthase ThiI [candidate division KSB1 bacterium]
MADRFAIGLYSGGLDSTLALNLVQRLGFKVVAVHFTTPFTVNLYGKKKKKLKKNGFIFKKLFLGKEYIELLKNPKYGYGKNFNPCVDCHIMMIKKAKSLMEEYGADFVFTGEVLGERPMSQRKDTLRIVERESGLEGRLLRPLSAKLLSETIPEKEGIIDRNKLFAIKGRSRKEQFKLAEEMGIMDFPHPAGGCPLTEENIAKRVEESLKHNEDTIFDMILLRLGRHLRLPGGEKLVSGRNEEENNLLLRLTRNKGIKLSVKDYSSTYLYLRDANDEDTIKEAGRVCARYSSVKNKESVEVYYWNKDIEKRKIIKVKPYSEEEVENLLI